MSEAARIGVTDAYWSHYRDDLNALLATALAAQADIRERRDRASVSVIRSLALRAEHGDALAEIVELAARPLDIGGPPRRRARDHEAEQALAAMAERIRFMTWASGEERGTPAEAEPRATARLEPPLPSPTPPPRPASRGGRGATVRVRAGRR